MLELDPGTPVGLVWRSALTGVVFVGAGLLAAAIPVSVPFLSLIIQLGSLAICGCALFRLSFPEELGYAVGFAAVVHVATIGVMFVVVVTLDHLNGSE